MTGRVVCFETNPRHEIVYLDVSHIVAIIGCTIITNAAAWSLDMAEADRDRVLEAFKNYRGTT